MEEPNPTAAEPVYPETPAGHDPYAALRHRDFLLYLAGSILSSLGMLAQETAVGWELFERTHDYLILGYVGLVEVVPVFLFTILAGHVADRFDRRRVLMAALSGMVVASLGLAWLSHIRGPIGAIYAMLFIVGVTRAFRMPAGTALMPQIVPENVFDNAVTWNSTGFQIAAVAGPALGGALIGIMHTPMPVYIVTAVMAVAYMGFLGFIRSRHTGRKSEPATWRSLIAGVRFVFQTKLVLASITLDMFAVLLGGATTLLPGYADDILHVGAEGLGWLRAAPSVGAFIMAITIAHRPPMRHAGRALLWAVAGFGAATIIFGISRNFWLSMAMLCALGALDNISVVVRHTLVQLRTPDALRGRVSAVNSMFIGASNELGGFESGLVARLFSPVISVVAGGVGTILVVLGVAALWPELRDLGSLKDLGESE